MNRFSLLLLSWLLVAVEGTDSFLEQFGSIPDSRNLDETSIDDGSYDLYEECVKIIDFQARFANECTCEPLENGDVRMACVEADCETCNIDYTSCGRFHWYIDLAEGAYLTENGIYWVYSVFQRNFQYDEIGPRTERITYGYEGCLDFPCDSCYFQINGEECNSCEQCDGGFVVDCENLVVNSSYASCVGNPDPTGVFEGWFYYSQVCTDDECSNATVTTPGDIHYGSFNGATDDSHMLPSCDYVNVDPFGKWYSVVGTGGTMMVSTCGSAWGLSSVSVFEGECDSLQCVGGGFQVRWCLAGPGGSFTWDSTEGTTYYVHVGSRWEVNYSFLLRTLELPPTDNVACDQTVTLEIDAGPEVGSLEEGAGLPSGGMPVCSTMEFSDGNAWYEVESTEDALLRVSTCSLLLTIESGISILDGGCDSLNCVAEAPISDEFVDCPYGSIAEFQALAGTTYYIVVSSYIYDYYIGTFEIEVSTLFPPVNNYCADAVAVQSDGSISQGDLTDATLTDHMSFPSCDGEMGPGVWYMVEGSDSALRAVVCSSASSAPSIMVYSGSCGALECASSSFPTEDMCGSNSGEMANFYGEMGTTYYLMVRANELHLDPNFPEENHFNVTIDPFVPIGNYDCTRAMPALPDGTTHMGNTVDSIRGDYNSCDSSRSPGAWYTVVGTGGPIRVSTCSDNTGFDTVIAVYAGECGNLECVGFNDDFYSPELDCGYASVFDFLSEVDVTYYIFIHGYSDGDVGEYELTVSTFEAVPNDVCDGAYGVVPDSLLYNSTDGAFPSTEAYCDMMLPEGSSVWYYIDGTDSLLQVSTCMSQFQFPFFGTLEVLAGSSCDNLTCVEVFQASTRGPDCIFGSAVNFFAESGVRYYVLISNLYTDAPGFFTLNTTVLPQAANDQCDSAAVVAADGTPAYGNTMFALPSDLSATTCPGSMSRGVWYQFVGEGQAVTASLCSVLLNFWTTVSVFAGSCQNLECVATSTHVQGCSLVSWPMPSEVSWQAEEGETYYIYVEGWSPEDSGEFEIVVTPIPTPMNDFCSDAYLIEPDGNMIVESTERATESGVPGCLGITDSRDVWYKVIGNGDLLSASLCHYETDFDSVLTVYHGNMGACDDLACVQENDDSCGTSSMVEWDSMTGETYFVRVHGFGQEFGNFGLTVTTKPTPVNNFCMGAIPIDSNGEVAIGSTENATDSGVEDCDSGGLSIDTWYQVEGTGGVMSASICHVETIINAVIGVYTGGCDNLMCEESQANVILDPFCVIESTMIWSSTVGETYFLRVQGYGEFGAGQFGLSMSEVPSPPNHMCETAINVDGDTSTIAGTTNGAVRDPIASQICPIEEIGGGGVWYRLSGTGELFGLWVYTEFDSAASIFRGSCGMQECAGSEWRRAYSFEDKPLVVWETEAGEDYYIYIQGLDPTEMGSFEIVVSPLDPPANNDCVDAILVEADGTVTVGATTNATQSDIIDCSGVSESSDVWYQVVGDGNVLSLSLCHTETDFSGAVSVYTSADDSCGTLSCAMGEEVFCGGGLEWISTPGVTYYLRIQGFGTEFGNFGMSIVSLIVPDNDECTGAIPIESNGEVITGNTELATSSGVTHCFFSDSFDVWYSVQGTGDDMEASLCHEETNYDTRLSVYTGDCQTLECVATNDDSPSCGLVSEVAFPTASSQTYWIRVYAFGRGSGDFGLSVNKVTNDVCVGADTLLPGDTVIGQTDTGATYSGMEACGDAATSSSPDIWYTIEGTGQHLTLSTCSDGTNFDTQISVYIGSCGALSCLAGNDDGCYSTASEVSWPSILGQIYYARVHGFGGYKGTFELSLAAGDGITINDSCESAFLLTPGTEVFGNTSDSSPDALTSSCGGEVSEEHNGLWYEMIGTGDYFFADTCVPSEFGTQISVFTGDCMEVSQGMAYMECVPFDHYDCGINSYVEWQSTPGTVYYIVVRGWSTTHGSFSLLVGSY